jgi:hypothetical protein
MKRTVKKVVIVFIVWVSLGQLLRFAWPEAHHSYSKGIGIPEDRTEVAERYEQIVADLTALGLRPEAEIDVPATLRGANGWLARQSRHGLVPLRGANPCLDRTPRYAGRRPASADEHASMLTGRHRVPVKPPVRLKEMILK